jgi:DNA repair protein RecO (recombination protein O)
MITWEEDGIIIETKRHGERSFIYHIFTKTHGRYAGLVRGSRASTSAALSRGCKVKARWSSRISEQLGEWKLDPIEPLSFEIFNDYSALMALDLVCHYIRSFLSERSSYPRIYMALEGLMRAMSGTGWLASFAHFEVLLLKELGFGLKLDVCAVTGAVEDLAYVSPRSGCAVHREVGAPYHDKIMILPAFLVGSHGPTPEDIRAAFTLTGFFLEKHFNERRFTAIFKVRHHWIEHVWNSINKI